MSTYSISSVVTGPEVKFAAMVSFNGATAEYYEVEGADGVPTTAEIAATLQAVADAAEAASIASEEAAAAIASIQIDENGQVII